MPFGAGAARNLIADVACLLLAAPFLYFPHWFPPWMVAAGYLLLVTGWLWRRQRLRVWLERTPADWAIFLLFFVMLPISILAAPDPLRLKYSIPRAHILIWNFCLFWLVVTHASRSAVVARWFGYALIGLGAIIALIAPLGIHWAYKLPILGPLLSGVPTPLIGVFQGAESGFSPNQVAGALLHVAPLALTLVAANLRREWKQPRWWLLLAATSLMLVLLGLTQSRAGLLGLAAGISALLLFGWNWSRRLLLAAAAASLLFVVWWAEPLTRIAATAPIDSAASASTLVSRTEIWSSAFYGLYDFAFTGIGLGTFRSLIWTINSLSLTAPGSDVAHAHNFFLQQGLDFGVPGLIALLTIYLVACAQIVVLWRSGEQWRTWAIGFVAALVAHATYSQLDAVAMGSKANFLFWMLIAVILGMCNCAVHSRRRLLSLSPEEAA